MSSLSYDRTISVVTVQLDAFAGSASVGDVILTRSVNGVDGCGLL